VRVCVCVCVRSAGELCDPALTAAKKTHTLTLAHTHTHTHRERERERESERARERERETHLSAPVVDVTMDFTHSDCAKAVPAAFLTRLIAANGEDQTGALPTKGLSSASDADRLCVCMCVCVFVCVHVCIC